MLYYLNNPNYNRGHKHNRGKNYCPRGCNNKGECVNGNHCFNCQDDKPNCCCYDQQCSGCIKK